MKVFTHSSGELSVPRSHPWSQSAYDPSHRYYDFKLHPELVRTSLEDFLPLSKWSAIERFYELVEWLNGPDSVLESNDCGTHGSKPNRSRNFAKPLECDARLMILFRDLPYNLYRENVEWLERATQRHLSSIDQTFEWGVVGTTVVPANYVTIPVPEEQQAGFQLVLTFWAWGDSDDEVMENLGRVFVNVRSALSGVCDEIKEFITAQSNRLSQPKT